MRQVRPATLSLLSPGAAGEALRPMQVMVAPQPASPTTPAPLLTKTPFSGQARGSAESGQEDPPPYDENKWDVTILAGITVAVQFGKNYFQLYTTLALLSIATGDPAWDSQLKSVLVWSTFVSGFVVWSGINSALAKRSMYYKLLRHHVILRFDDRPRFACPLSGLNGVSWLNWVPAQYLRFVNAVLACIALGCCVLALSLFGTRWHANNKASDYSNLHQKWGHAPWSFLSGALSAAISIVTLISAYSSLEAFYLTLLPFNVLMADGAEDSSCDHEMAAHKAWVSRCRLVLEGDFLRLAAVKIQEASIREEALLKAARAKGVTLFDIPPAMAASEKYKQLAAELYNNPSCKGVREVKPAPGLCARLWYNWNIYLFPYASLVSNDRDPAKKPSAIDKALCCCTSAEGESALGVISRLVFLAIFAAIAWGIFATQATGKTVACSAGLMQYCVAPSCFAPVCPAPAPAPAAILS